MLDFDCMYLGRDNAQVCAGNLFLPAEGQPGEEAVRGGARGGGPRPGHHAGDSGGEKHYDS